MTHRRRPFDMIASDPGDYQQLDDARNYDERSDDDNKDRSEDGRDYKWKYGNKSDDGSREQKSRWQNDEDDRDLSMKWKSDDNEDGKSQNAKRRYGSDHNDDDREHNPKWKYDEANKEQSGKYQQDDGSNWSGSGNSESGDRKNLWNRNDNWKDRTDGWNNDKRNETWGDKKTYWGDRSDKYDERNNKDAWNEKKENWNKRRDDPWDDSREKERDRDYRRGGDSVDEGRDDSSRRGRDRKDRDRSPRDRRDRDHSRERNRTFRRSYSKSPERGNHPSAVAGEWICKCGAYNFKKRLLCYKRCGASRSDAISVGTGDVKASNQKYNDLAIMISTQQFTAQDVPKLAAYSAHIYAENKTEHATYLNYYTDYYTKILLQKNNKTTAETKTEADKVNVAAAVAQSAINQLQAKTVAPTKILPTGVDNKTYPVPDISTYLYDQTSGYYYDSNTGLYYDANTQYYFNNQINQYLYWDSTKRTYILASMLQNYSQNNATTSNQTTPNNTATPVAESSEQNDAEDDRKKSETKVDKVKVAKKIAKDMERWARAMNQKKEASKIGLEPQANSNASSSKSADIGFSVLEQRVPISNQINNEQPSTLVPSYGGGSDSSGDESEALVDWDKLACLLCKRQFPSKDVLEKHQVMSELHKQNLEAFRDKHNGRSGSKNKEPSVYRDRAAERRLKYGEDDIPIVRPVRHEPIIQSSVPQEIGEGNIGNKLLKKMGWTAGKGLGKEGQGILGPVEATTTGLGRKKGIYTAGPGESYRGCIKKLTMARYQDLLGSEEKT